IVRLDQRTQFPPRHHLLHLFQEPCPSSLLRVPLESRHHRQCPLLAQRVHAGTTLSILPVEREDLIRVSLAIGRRPVVWIQIHCATDGLLRLAVEGDEYP